MLKYAIMLAFVISIGWFLTTLPLAQPYLSCLKTPVPDPNQDGFAAEFKRSVQCERMAFTDKLVRAFDPIDGRVGGLKTHDASTHEPVVGAKPASPRRSRSAKSPISG
jgi:hypothetical protein